MSEKKEIIIPDGIECRTEDGGVTERAQERAQEDEQYTPVIVKRTDEAFRHPDDILEDAINAGLEQIKRPFVSLALSSVAAGMILSFTVMAAGVIASLCLPYDNPLLLRLLVAAAYPMGFVICIMSGTELFTEHTATAVYPVLDKKARPLLLARLWLVVLTGNIIGSFLGASFLCLGEPVVRARQGYLSIAAHLMGFDTTALFTSAVLAGWLMALGAWLVLATHSTIGQLVCIYIVTFLIGLGGLHHSIAGSTEMFAAILLSDEITILTAGRFLICAVAGNAVGGSIFVALLNYGHIRKTRIMPAM